MKSKIEKDWITMAGLRAVVIRGTGRMTHLCGYVAVGKDHPLFKKGYTDKCPVLAEMWKETKALPMKNSPIPIFLAAGKEDEEDLLTPEMVFRVHGGITYAGGDGKYPIEEDGLWWFGFDCAHHGDCTFLTPMGRVWEVEGVVKECEGLANQLSAVFSSHCESEE